ncbi:SoxR reducing system RseC family protein [Kallipyga massiliensis]|uniref:SoxR reducing system RseC family protein n=1 Tax=Kallipyga massiliensis TaxID=1472764 RepID=UPI0004ADFF40|nr:SoxR reducing system RseC family protein [Kallipyga massiliensis]
MKNNGFVMENKEGLSHILVYREEACGSCSASGICKSKKASTQWVRNSLDAQPGDTVSLDMPDHIFIGSVFVLYVLPLLLFLAGLFSIYLATKDEVLSFIGGLVGLGVFYILARRIDQSASKDMVKMVRILSQEELGTIASCLDKKGDDNDGGDQDLGVSHV